MLEYTPTQSLTVAAALTICIGSFISGNADTLILPVFPNIETGSYRNSDCILPG
ncbi:hypothetical protein Q0F98_36865 [Paenibacillus amylolyticus]|nr:hypothetical protein Q0F98_36865 [Paenibacillus amylolyticus]